MLDVGRKFFDLAFIERHIRDFAYAKGNYLHLHLSEVDALGGYGFRLESMTDGARAPRRPRRRSSPDEHAGSHAERAPGRHDRWCARIATGELRRRSPGRLGSRRVYAARERHGR